MNDKTINTIYKYFSKKEFLDHALTHKSWVNEHPGIRTSNERLEFLGDAILEHVVSVELFNKFPNEEEGFLTALRANIVNTVNLSRVAKKIDAGKFLLLSKGEEDGGGRENQSLLADTVEAIIGALYIDSGFEKVQEFIYKNILSDLDTLSKKPLKDAKSRLQELVQSKGLETPKYTVVKEEGPDHNKNFVLRVSVSGKTFGEGTGKNKSEAAQGAAEDALEKISSQ